MNVTTGISQVLHYSVTTSAITQAKTVDYEQARPVINRQLFGSWIAEMIVTQTQSLPGIARLLETYKLRCLV